MDSMRAALRMRRQSASGGLLDEAQPTADDSKGLKDLLMSMSNDQKQQLLEILMNEQKSASEIKSIENGEQSSGEKAELMAEANGADDMDQIMESDGDYESDEDEDAIAESMLASSDKMKADTDAKPRNLGERVRMSLASKLKKKGK